MRHLNFVDMTILERVDSRVGSDRFVLRKLPYRHLPRNYKIFLLNDSHIGCDQMSEQYILKSVRNVCAERNNFVLFQGDQFECIRPSDRRFSMDTHANKMSRLDDQIEYFKEIYDPLADRVLGIEDGNHEETLSNDIRPNKMVAHEWNTIYANGKEMKLIFPEWRLYSCHGAGTINSRAIDPNRRLQNNLAMLKVRMAQVPADDCDIITCGHYHHLWLYPPARELFGTSGMDNKLHQHYAEPGNRIDLGNGDYRIPLDDKWLMCCGSFLRSYMEDMRTWTGGSMFRMTELGYGVIEVKNDKPVNVEVVALRE